MKFKLKPLPFKYTSLFNFEEELGGYNVPTSRIVYYFMTKIHEQSVCHECLNKEFRTCNACLKFRYSEEYFKFKVPNAYYKYVLKLPIQLIPDELINHYYEGCYFDTNYSAIAGLILYANSKNIIPIVHSNFPLPLSYSEFEQIYTKLRDKFHIYPELSKPFLSLRLSELETDLNSEQYIGEIKLVPKIVKPVVPSELEYFRAKGYQYVTINKLNPYKGIRLLNPSSKRKIYFNELPFENLFELLSHKQHFALPLKVFTYDVDAKILLFGVLYRHNTPYKFIEELPRIMPIHFDTEEILYEGVATLPVSSLKKYNFKLDFQVLFGYLHLL